MNVIFKILDATQFTLFIMLIATYSLQLFYMILGAFPSKKFPEAQKNHRYGILIAARNEAKVIAQLIDSIQKQDYPSELVDIFVVADNCTDSTAEIARRAGATVYERFNTEKRGKSYALDFLINQVFENQPADYKGFLVFDADNLLSRNYIREMNKAVDSGLEIVTSYRNSKNFGVNWITSGYALCFLRECRLVHRSRQKLGTSTFVSGTGFYVDAGIFRQEKGWKYNLLTEDIEFSIAQILKDRKVGYAEDAEFYDEQPETFIQSYHQRMRWIRGAYQTFWHYGRRLFMGIFRKRGYARLDLLLFILPMPFVVETCMLANVVLHLIDGIIMRDATGDTLMATLESSASFLVHTYTYLCIVCAWVMILEWKRIKLRPMQKIRHVFLAPLFVSTYLVIILAAMFYKVKWKQIRRNCTLDIAELEKQQQPCVDAAKMETDRNPYEGYASNSPHPSTLTSAMPPAGADAKWVTTTDRGGGFPG